MENVFVYGTLMKGYWNHHFLSNSLYVGEGKLHGYEMYHVSSFPGIVAGGSEVINGEVYRVDEITLKSLDKLEHEGFMYVRKMEPVRVGNEIIDCYVYVWNYNIEPGVEKVEKTPWKPKGRKYS